MAGRDVPHLTRLQSYKEGQPATPVVETWLLKSHYKRAPLLE